MKYAHAETVAVRPPRARSLRAAAGLLVLASVAWAIPAPGQCLISSGPNRVFANANWPSGFTANGASRRHRVRRGNPPLRQCELRIRGLQHLVEPGGPVEPRVGKPGDHARLLRRRPNRNRDVRPSPRTAPGWWSALTIRYDCRGSNLVFVPGTGLFQLKGDFGASKSTVVVQQLVQQAKTRYIGYALSRERLARRRRHHYPARDTTQGETSRAKQNASFAGGSGFFLADNFLFYRGLRRHNPDDRRPQPGPRRRDHLGLSASEHPALGLGTPRGRIVSAFSAAIDPTSGGNRIYIVAEFMNSSSNSTGFALMKLEGGTLTVVNTFVPSGALLGRGLVRRRLDLAPGDAATSDINVLMWGKSPVADPVRPLLDERQELDSGFSAARFRPFRRFDRRILVRRRQK